MPELPDIEVYIECLKPRVIGLKIQRLRVFNPFLVRTFEPPIETVIDKSIRAIYRIGKRIVFEFDGELFLVLHLMIAGRLQWKPVGAKPPGKIGLAAFDFPTGSLMLTEAGTKRRASLHLVSGKTELARHNPGGLEVLSSTVAQFGEVLRRENHTLKRTLTDPRILSGIGNSYADEILFSARLSPLLLTQRLNDNDIAKLHESTIRVLTTWRDNLRAEVGNGFPQKVTAFRPEMAVHGRFGKPCPDCGTKVQRIRYADNETNYCPRCQTDGKVLADRSLSRLLRDDWPRTIEDLEDLRG